MAYIWYTTFKAKKMEIIISAKMLDSYINFSDSILDVAAGTGIYSLYYAKKGHNVFAMDITPKHIQIIKNKLSNEFKELHINAEVNNAVGLGMFEENVFNTVLCFGPIYHLIEIDERNV
ncbi:class I SAM-dependent methyltransferase [Lutispora sp.]|uniref:class I SAM-dependent methyltransferase n=1 Tax=Lutispora sp. TaxID=2828727 RepID=UPI002B1E9874|nr:class I SAM-dependent methyltransferase [Lutispora sp.]MEA4963593.1 class I SAM-dependent methyltransferase [Lutispora sp.]